MKIDSSSDRCTQCNSRLCSKCGKCKKHGFHSGTHEGAMAGALSIGALAGISGFLIVVFSPFSIAAVGAALGTVAAGSMSGAVVGAGIGAALSAIGSRYCTVETCKCKRKHKKKYEDH